MAVAVAIAIATAVAAAIAYGVAVAVAIAISLGSAYVVWPSIITMAVLKQPTQEAGPNSTSSRSTLSEHASW